MAGQDELQGLLFDKDGTLFDFALTWNGWAHRVLEALDDRATGGAPALAQAMGFDLDRGGFRPDSRVIAGTNAEVAGLMLPLLPGWSRADLAAFMTDRAAEAEPVPPVALEPLLSGLTARGLDLGVMTNDGARSAEAQLARAGVRQHFSLVIGADSGHGAKPDPAPLLAWAEARGLAPGAVAMVGDSTHDLHAGRAAGMATVAVLTGLATAADLAPHADVVLPDIGHLPAWLDGR